MTLGNATASIAVSGSDLDILKRYMAFKGIESASEALSGIIKASEHRERVLILLDVMNVHLAARGELEGIEKDIDWTVLMNQAAAGREIVRAIAFDNKFIQTKSNGSEVDTTAQLHEDLAECGWDLDLGSMFDDPEHQKEVDVSLASTLIKNAYDDAFDVAVLISGDRDYCPAVRLVTRDLHKRVEVMAFKKAMSQDLSRCSDKTTYLDSAFIYAMRPVKEVS